MIIAYSQLRSELRAKIWPPPSGESRNLRPSHDAFFQDAMAAAAKWVPCLKVEHYDVYRQCATFVDCALTVAPAPDGQVLRVFTIANDEWCDKVFYAPSSIREVRCWSQNLIRQFTPPANLQMAVLPGGVKFAEASTDIPGGRMRYGLYALHNHRIYVAPWIQSNEKLVIEWSGRKAKWNDDDFLNTGDRRWNHDVRKYIEHYVEYEHWSRFESDLLHTRELMDKRDDALGEAIHTCAQMQRLEEERACQSVNVRGPTKEQIEDDAVPDPEDSIVFAVIGDFGDPANAPKPEQVADLVKGWGPGFIVTLGDNIYEATDNYDDAVGALYGDYITEQLGTNRFWPSIGNHDHNDPAGGIDDYYAYFTLPNNERYYDFIKGPVHFFVLHSGIQDNNQDNTEEPDGIKQDSKQAEWLRVRMALSTAKWKVVIVHDAPYTSVVNNYPGFTYLRWPFAAWGADVVLSGDSHGYERQLVDGLPYIINGAGGTGLSAFSPTPDATSLLRYNADNGAMRCEASCTELKMQFYNTTAELIDTLTLTK